MLRWAPAGVLSRPPPSRSRRRSRARGRRPSRRPALERLPERRVRVEGVVALERRRLVGHLMRVLRPANARGHADSSPVQSAPRRCSSSASWSRSSAGGRRRTSRSARGPAGAGPSSPRARRAAARPGLGVDVEPLEVERALARGRGRSASPGPPPRPRSGGTPTPARGCSRRSRATGIAVLVLAEPVDVEDLRQLGARRRARPISSQWREVVGHVVAAERQHGERVEAQLADVAGGRGRRLRRHRRAEEHAVLPVERLVHERHDGRAAAAEQEGVDRHAGRVLPLGRDRRALRGRRREARVGMRGRRVGRRASSRCRASRSRAPGGSSVMPSHQTSPSSVSAQLVKIAFCGERLHGVGVRLLARCRARRRRSRPRG